MACGTPPVAGGKRESVGSGDYVTIQASLSYAAPAIRFMRITTTGLCRVRLSFSAGVDFAETVEFDVARAETLVFVADSFTVEAKAYADPVTISWIAAESSAYARTELQFNVLVAGSADSDTDPTLVPPSAAQAIRVIPRSASGFTLELMRGSTVISTFTDLTLPADGAPLGVADRVVLTSADPLRVVYVLRL